MEAVILAGGLGTRLHSVVEDLPKPMVPINGKPFLRILLDYLVIQKISKFVISVGYKKERIIDYFGRNYRGIPINYSIENEPLGTGGGIVHSLEYIDDENFIAINGDTFFKIQYPSLMENHFKTNADVTIGLCLQSKSQRYGSIITSSDGRIIEFKEKDGSSNTINGGVYIIRRTCFEQKPLGKKFSLEKDFFNHYVNDLRIYGIKFSDLFIDIGTPESLEISKTLLA